MSCAYKSKMKFAILLILFLVSNVRVIVACHEDEREALLAFKSNLADPSNRLSSWNDQDCCTWQGINCSDSLHVVALNLRNPNPESVLISMNGKVISSSNSNSTAITGTISPSLFTLTHIHTLDLSFNDFMSSEIPTHISNLTSLAYLNLSNAVFGGSITTQFANLTSLVSLDVSCSFLVSNFPSISYNLTSSLKINVGSYLTYTSSSNLSSPSLEWLQGMDSLKTLVVTGVDLSDASKSIHWAKPISFLHNLTRLQLSSCGIAGEVPADYLVNLSHLRSLQMDYNNLNSTIPDKLRNLTSLAFLDLTKSNLQGPLPHLPRLKVLHVGSNSNLTIDLDKFFNLPWPKLWRLDISSTRATGSLPSSFANTSSLIAFIAYDCQIKGSLPSSITNLTKLIVLNLDMNNLSGTLPQSVGNLKDLQYLSLMQNNLQGTIPESICDIPGLQSLSLSSNNLTGHLPDCISQMESLRYLDTSINAMMKGTVSLRSLARIKLISIGLGYSGITVKVHENPFPPSFQPTVLELSSCGIGGSIPDFISGLTGLEYLSLARNNLYGEIPLWLFNLPSLGYLDLSFNTLQGVLPRSLQLRSFFGPATLNLGNNKFHGPIPLQLHNIESIDLSWNNFTRTIPEQIDVGSTIYLSLSGNNLFGPIPHAFCQETNVLELIDLSRNELSGTVPTSLGNCTSLLFLDLRWNNLSGKIPNELGGATSLSYLGLSNNQFDGAFPSFIQKLQNLMVLQIGYNKFKGNIPQFIGDLKNLHIIVLEYNSFSGPIPREINRLEKLQFIGFSNNNLSGPIPDRLDGSKMLMSRPADGNILGYVVATIYAGVELHIKSKGSSYELDVVRTYHSGIDLSSNALTGNIPWEIGLLHGVYTLNVSHNALSGKIPESIGRMRGLESLDLSFNNLTGRIPESLNSLDALSTVDFSYNNLSGEIPPGMRFDTWYGDGSAYIGNEFLCGVPGGITCNTSNVTSDGEDIDDGDEVSKERLIMYGVVIGGYGVGFWGLFMVLHLVKKERRKRFWEAIDEIAFSILRICNLK